MKYFIKQFVSLSADIKPIDPERKPLVELDIFWKRLSAKLNCTYWGLDKFSKLASKTRVRSYLQSLYFAFKTDIPFKKRQRNFT